MLTNTHIDEFLDAVKGLLGRGFRYKGEVSITEDQRNENVGLCLEGTPLKITVNYESERQEFHVHFSHLPVIGPYLSTRRGGDPHAFESMTLTLPGGVEVYPNGDLYESDESEDSDGNISWCFSYANRGRALNLVAALSNIAGRYYRNRLLNAELARRVSLAVPGSRNQFTDGEMTCKIHHLRTLPVTIKVDTGRFKSDGIIQVNFGPCDLFKGRIRGEFMHMASGVRFANVLMGDDFWYRQFHIREEDHAPLMAFVTGVALLGARLRDEGDRFLDEATRALMSGFNATARGVVKASRTPGDSCVSISWNSKLPNLAILPPLSVGVHVQQGEGGGYIVHARPLYMFGEYLVQDQESQTAVLRNPLDDNERYPDGSLDMGADFSDGFGNVDWDFSCDDRGRCLELVRLLSRMIADYFQDEIQNAALGLESLD